MIILVIGMFVCRDADFGKANTQTISAYQTLYTCLETIAIISSPIAPFYFEHLFQLLNSVTYKHKESSVHLVKFPEYNELMIDSALEEKMQLAQKICSMTLSLRKRSNIRVRQPLSRIIVPVNSQAIAEQINSVADIIKAEVNIKEVEILTDKTNIISKKVKPNFKLLGPRYGKIMKLVAEKIANLSQSEIFEFEQNQKLSFFIESIDVLINIDEVEIITEDIPGWVVNNEGSLTVALDTTITKQVD